MEARTTLWAVVAAALLSIAARYQTANFIVNGPNAQIAEQVGQAAEQYRREIAKEWLGKEMPDWNRPCPVKVHITNGAGGVTSFRFEQGEVFGWTMTVQGPLDQILHSVLPHEVTHTIFASHFRQPLPRWADEGACTTVEHTTERAKQNRMLIEFLRTGRGIAFTHMFRMKEYPRDMLPLYSQGHSLATFLLNQGGKPKFLEYLAEGLKQEDWNTATRNFYGYDHLSALQNAWLDWVQQGGPASALDVTAIAARGTPRGGRSGDNIIYRGQSADPPSVTTGSLAPVRPAAAVLPDTPSQNSRGESDGRVAGSGDSKGWRPPQELTSPSELRQQPRESLSSREPSLAGAQVADGRSRYERANSTRVTRVPGQHLPDTSMPTGNPYPVLPGAPFSLPSPPASTPCLGGG